MAESLSAALQTQYAYLGAVLMEPKRCEQSLLRMMAPMFAEGGPREVYSACKALVYAGKAVDVLTVIGQLGAEYKTLVMQMAECCPTVSHVEDYAALIVEDYLRAQLAGGLGALSLSGESSELIREKVRALLDQQDAVCSMQTDGSAQGFDEVLDATVEELGKPDTSLKLGWRALDRFGLMEPTNTVVIAGRPGCGKTDFAINLAARLSKKYRVYYLTLEETDKKLMQRMLSKITCIDAARMRDRKLTAEELGSLRNVAAGLKKHHNMILDSDSNVTVEGIRAKLLRFRPQVAFIDHIGLIAGNDAKQTEYQRLSEATRQLKMLAMQMGIVIVELSQLSRSTVRDGGKFGTLADLRGSGTIEQDANAVVFVQNKLPATGEDLHGADAYLDTGVLVAKNREGALGVCGFKWQPQYHKWEPAEPPPGGAVDEGGFVPCPAEQQNMF